MLNERIIIADDNKFDLLFGINLNHWFNDQWGLILNSDLAIAGDNERDFRSEIRGLNRLSDLNNLRLRQFAGDFRSRSRLSLSPSVAVEQDMAWIVTSLARKHPL